MHAHINALRKKCRQWVFAHNGGVANFAKIKRPLINLLDEESYLSITGTTDSEHMFALFLTLLPPGAKVSDAYVVMV